MELIPGSTYRIVHKRKGEFIAQFVHEELGDEVDPTLLTFRFDTRRGTGQERLARAAKAEWTETALRPSLIVDVEYLPDTDWRLQARAFESPPPTAEHKPRPWYAGLRRWTIKHLRFDPIKWLQRHGVLGALFGVVCLIAAALAALGALAFIIDLLVR